MKADQLKQALRKIIQEEVKKAVQEEVSKAMGRVLVEMVKEIKNPGGSQTVTAAAPPINTKNSKLNSVLAETARNFTPLKKTNDSRVSMADMLEEGFEKIGADEDIGIEYSQPQAPVDDGTKIGFLKSIVTESVGVPSVLDKGADVPDVLKGVFKKDFRAVMRAIDDKKKNGSSGAFNMGQVLSG